MLQYNLKQTVKELLYQKLTKVFQELVEIVVLSILIFWTKVQTLSALEKLGINNNHNINMFKICLNNLFII